MTEMRHIENNKRDIARGRSTDRQSSRSDAFLHAKGNPKGTRCFLDDSAMDNYHSSIGLRTAGSTTTVRVSKWR
jgi:hypothetical protein